MTQSAYLKDENSLETRVNWSEIIPNDDGRRGYVVEDSPEAVLVAVESAVYALLTDTSHALNNAAETARLVSGCFPGEPGIQETLNKAFTLGIEGFEGEKPHNNDLERREALLQAEEAVSRVYGSNIYSVHYDYWGETPRIIKNHLSVARNLVGHLVLETQVCPGSAFGEGFPIDLIQFESKLMSPQSFETHRKMVSGVKFLGPEFTDTERTLQLCYFFQKVLGYQELDDLFKFTIYGDPRDIYSRDVRSVIQPDAMKAVYELCSGPQKAALLKGVSSNISFSSSLNFMSNGISKAYIPVSLWVDGVYLKYNSDDSTLSIDASDVISSRLTVSLVPILTPQTTAQELLEIRESVIKHFGWEQLKKKP